MVIALFFVILFVRDVQFAMPASNQIFVRGSIWSQDRPSYANFENNLKFVLGTLASQASQTGFYHSTFGQSPDQVTGLYLCRGDLDGQDCSDCVTYVTDSILNCSKNEWSFDNETFNYTEAVLWYDHCVIRFSNKSFIGQMDLNSNGVSVSDKHNNGTCWNKIRFVEVLSETLTQLPVQAANDESGKRFATKVVKLTRFESLYAIAQCTLDLTPSDCNRCLTKLAWDLLRMNASPRSSGRSNSNNCMVRYETFPFFNIPSSSLQSDMAMTNITPKNLSGPHSEYIQVM